MAASVVIVAVTRGRGSERPSHPAAGGTSALRSPAPHSDGSSPSPRRPLVDATDVSGRGIAAKYQPHSVAWLQGREPDITLSVHDIAVGPYRRAYVVAAPKHVTGRLPAVVYLHGVHAAVATEMARDELLALPRSGRAILVYPVGYEASFAIEGHSCCGAAGKATPKPDDVAFVRAAVADAQRVAPIDRDRTYLIGFSNGGKLAWDTLCDDTTPYAAVAVMSATPLNTCRGHHQSVPIWLGIGTKDLDIPTYRSGKPPVPQVAAQVAAWRRRDGCDAAPATREVGAASVTEWSCAGGTAVDDVVYAGQGHVWPPASAVGAPASAATLVWGFLSRFSRR